MGTETRVVAGLPKKTRHANHKTSSQVFWFFVETNQIAARLYANDFVAFFKMLFRTKTSYIYR